MSANQDKKVVLVTRKTRLEELVTRFQTLAQAKFYIEHLRQDFHAYEIEHQIYMEAKQTVLDALSRLGRSQVIDRMFLPNFLFGPEDIVIALGQDGLVANTMKYLNGHALLGVNPDPYRYDGVLLPFTAKDMNTVITDTAREYRQYNTVTMAMALLGDGQVLYAVNDLFIGPKSHVSARYEIKYGESHEIQSSSGVIVSTGLGSTGWMKSIYTGAIAIAHANADDKTQPYQSMAWETKQLRFAVREPFPSRSSSATIIYGNISTNQPLILESHMPENGTIFSDGIEADYLDFNTGTVAEIKIADRQGRLII